MMKLAVATLSDNRLCAELADHPELTLLLDFDGTLIPFAATAELAVLDPAGRELLQRLRDTGVQIVVVSGRPRTLVEPLRGDLDGVWWMAEHGSWRSLAPDQWDGPEPASEVTSLLQLFEPFAGIAGVRIESKSRSVCLHWRLVEPDQKAGLIARCELACDEWLELHPDFERLDGVEMIEVRDRRANKGHAVAWVRERRPGARIIAIGDDHTDADMFAALADDDLSIGVGSSQTRARCWLRDPSAVRGFLSWLVDRRTPHRPMPLLALSKRTSETTAKKAELVVVSNRTPAVSNHRQREVGGLVAALAPALTSYDGVWLGWSGRETEGERKVVFTRDTTPPIAAFDFAPTWRERFYGGFCNRALWPLFHGFPGRVRYSEPEWRAYNEANAQFAKHAHELVAPDGMVWVHDYHLLLAGRDLRARGFRGPLGLFLHIPFPQSDLLDTMPWADELLSAMLSYDLIGFHTEQWAENFCACVRARWTDRAPPDLAVLPIGVDPETFGDPSAAEDDDVAGLRTLLGDRKLILGVDRLDYSKGIPERLAAFEHLLDSAPEWRGRVTFVQISVPSRSEVPEYAELRGMVENMVGRINGRFGEADWVPVRYLYRSYEHRVLAQLYRLADVALVTPLRDGLNLVAKEFVVAQDMTDPGVLVLSRFAGAAAELRHAILTNPFHVDGVAADLDRALRMDADERRSRHARLATTLRDQTPQRWATAFLDRLACVASAPGTALGDAG